MQITEHSTSVLTLQEKESFFPARRHLWKTLLAALLLYPLLFLLPSLLGESLTMTCTCSKGQGTSCTIAKTGMGKNPLRINYLLEKEVVEAKSIFSVKRAGQGNNNSLVLTTEMGTVPVSWHDPNKLAEKINAYVRICAENPRQPPYSWDDSSLKEKYRMMSFLFFMGGTFMFIGFLFITTPVLYTFNKAQGILKLQHHGMLRCPTRQYELANIKGAEVALNEEGEKTDNIHLWLRSGEKILLVSPARMEASSFAQLVNTFLDIDPAAFKTYRQDRIYKQDRRQGLLFFVVFLLSGLLIFGMGIAFLVQGREYPVAAFLFFISGLWLCFTFFVLGRDIFSGKGKKE